MPQLRNMALELDDSGLTMKGCPATKNGPVKRILSMRELQTMATRVSRKTGNVTENFLESSARCRAGGPLKKASAHFVGTEGFEPSL